MFRVTWDNTYSVFASKTIAYTIEAHQRTLPPSAAPPALGSADLKDKVGEGMAVGEGVGVALCGSQNNGSRMNGAEH